MNTFWKTYKNKIITILSDFLIKEHTMFWNFHGNPIINFYFL